MKSTPWYHFDLDRKRNSNREALTAIEKQMRYRGDMSGEQLNNTLFLKKIIPEYKIIHVTVELDKPQARLSCPPLECG